MILRYLAFPENIVLKKVALTVPTTKEVNQYVLSYNITCLEDSYIAERKGFQS